MLVLAIHVHAALMLLAYVPRMQLCHTAHNRPACRFYDGRVVDALAVLEAGFGEGAQLPGLGAYHVIRVAAGEEEREAGDTS